MRCLPVLARLTRLHQCAVRAGAYSIMNCDAQRNNALKSPIQCAVLRIDVYVTNYTVE